MLVVCIVVVYMYRILDEYCVFYLFLFEMFFLNIWREVSVLMLGKRSMDGNIDLRCYFCCFFLDLDFYWKVLYKKVMLYINLYKKFVLCM